MSKPSRVQANRPSAHSGRTVPCRQTEHSLQQIASGLIKSLYIGSFIGTRKMDGIPAEAMGTE